MVLSFLNTGLEVSLHSLPSFAYSAHVFFSSLGRSSPSLVARLCFPTSSSSPFFQRFHQFFFCVPSRRISFQSLIPLTLLPSLPPLSLTYSLSLFLCFGKMVCLSVGSVPAIVQLKSIVLTPHNLRYTRSYNKRENNIPRKREERGGLAGDQATIATAAPLLAGSVPSPFVIVVSPSATFEIFGAGGGSFADRNSLILGIDARRRCVGRASSSVARRSKAGQYRVNSVQSRITY